MRRTAAVSTLLLVFLPFIVPGSLPAAAQQVGTDTLVGTIQSWDARQGELALLVGVGLALRTATFRVPSGTPATTAGASMPLGSLRAGDVVRVIGGTRPEGRVAYSIERLVLAGRAP